MSFNHQIYNDNAIEGVETFYYCLNLDTYWLESYYYYLTRNSLFPDNIYRGNINRTMVTIVDDDSELIYLKYVIK